MSLKTTDNTQPSKRAKQRAAARTANVEEAAAHSPVLLLGTSLEERRFDDEARRNMICETAYFRAAQRGFEPGGELDDWLGAEAEVDARLCGHE